MKVYCATRKNAQYVIGDDITVAAVIKTSVPNCPISVSASSQSRNERNATNRQIVSVGQSNVWTMRGQWRVVLDPG